MAMKKCKECGKEISTKAVSCPGCGAISKKKTGCFTWLVAGFFIIVMISVFKNYDYDGVNKTETVYNSALDGSVYQVKQWFKENLKDPNSFEAIEWGQVVNVENLNLPHKFIVRCKYRAKNSFGGYEIGHKIFYLDRLGNIVSVIDLDK